AVAGVVVDRKGQRAARGGAVVRRHAGGDGGILVGGRAVVGRGQVGDRVDRDVDGLARALARGRIGDRVGEAIGAVEIGVRRVGVGAVAVVEDGAVAGVVVDRKGQRAARGGAV